MHLYFYTSEANFVSKKARENVIPRDKEIAS